MDLATLQDLMDRTYGEQDRARGPAATIAWLTEELGELAQAVRKGSRQDQVHELGDVLAWLASLANQLGISLDEGAARSPAVAPSATPCHVPARARRPVGDAGAAPTATRAQPRCTPPEPLTFWVTFGSP